jgi:hypothetical protein
VNVVDNGSRVSDQQSIGRHYTTNVLRNEACSHPVSWFLVAASAVLSQTAVVTRNVNLRPDPSTGQDPLVKLVPPAQVELLEPDQTNGFYHVKAGQNEGWVWGKSIRITAGGPPPPPPHSAAAGGGLIEQSRASAISSSWDKGTPENNVFRGAEGDCAETGDGGDTNTNKLKNRVDIPTAYQRLDL